MPQMGESVTEGTILEWHVSEGQEVSEGDTVVEVSTDKVDAEVPAPAAGVITKLLVDVDDTVEVGQVARPDRSQRHAASGDPRQRCRRRARDGRRWRGRRRTSGDDVAAERLAGAGQVTVTKPQPATDPAAPGREAEEAGGTLVISMPEMGESVTEGTVLEWHVSEGQQVARGRHRDRGLDRQGRRRGSRRRRAGRSPSFSSSPMRPVQVGQALAEMTAGEGRGDVRAAHRAGARDRGGHDHHRRPRTAMAAPPPSPAASRPPRASTSARSRAAAPGGKVTKEDVLAAAEGNGGAAAAPAVAGEAKPLRGPGGDARAGDGREHGRSRPRPRSAPLPVDTLDAKRKAINAALKERGMKVSFTHLIAWAIVRPRASGR